jgi:hypothetical protein
MFLAALLGDGAAAVSPALLHLDPVGLTWAKAVSS